VMDRRAQLRQPSPRRVGLKRRHGAAAARMSEDACVICLEPLGQGGPTARFCCEGVEYHEWCLWRYERSLGASESRCPVCRKRRPKPAVYFACKVTVDH